MPRKLSRCCCKPLVPVPFQIPSGSPPPAMSASASVKLWGVQAVASYTLSYFDFGQVIPAGSLMPTRGRTSLVSGLSSGATSFVGVPFPGGLDYLDGSNKGWAMKPKLSLLGSTRLLPLGSGLGPQTRLDYIIQARWPKFAGEQTRYTAWSNLGGGSSGEFSTTLGHVGKLVNGQYVYSQMAYANTPVAIRGDAVTLYRNGVLVMSATNPTPQQGIDATSLNGAPRDGSYFVVSQMVDNTVQADGNRQLNLKDFSSFVISSTRPAVAIVPPDDEFDGGANVPKGLLFASKQVLSYDELYGRPHEFNWWNAQTNQTVPQSSAVGLSNLPVGTHALTIENFATLKDVFGNLAISPPTVTWTKHAEPANERFGARPRLVGPPKGYDARPILPQQSPVESVDLVFDREVLASSVTVGQFSFLVNGQSVGVAGILQETPTQWKVFLPAAAQQPNTKCELSYNPAGTVTDDIKIVRFASQADFPPPSASKYLTAYVSEQDNSWFSKSPSGYVGIPPESPPLDRFGVHYGPEPCVLVARTAWVMALAEPVPRRIDLTASFSPYSIGSIVSVDGLAIADTEKNDEVEVSFTSPIGLGFYPKPQESCKCADEFWPGVPQTGAGVSPEEPGQFAEWSWFGLETTIDPAPPMRLSSISVPKASQRHSSAIRSTKDITKFKIFSPGGTTLFAQAAANGIEVSATLDGDLLPQNYWRCLTGGQGYQLMQQETDPLSNSQRIEHEIDRIQAIVWAERTHRQYKSLGTTVLGMLALRIHIVAFIKITTTQYISGGTNTGGFGNVGGGGGLQVAWTAVTYGSREIFGGKSFEPSEEIALEAGNQVPFSMFVAGVNQPPLEQPAAGWKIQALL